MLNRNKFNEVINFMDEINKKNKELKMDSEISEIKQFRDNFDIKLIVIGHFSSGKSSLINGLLNRPEFLREAQAPETAIATEINYGTDEKIFAYTDDGNKVTVDNVDNFMPDKYKNLEYIVNSEELKKIDSFTLVDTPGFDSGIEAHAKALSQYIGKGSAYLVVVDQEKGTIDKVTLDFILEISNYTKQIAVLINKCDKILPSEAESIANSARETLERYNLNYKVYTVSKKDEDISDKLISIISEFNPQEVFDERIKNLIKLSLSNSENILLLNKKNMYLNTYEIDNEIKKYEQSHEELKYTFDRKRQDISDNLSSTVDKVISDIQTGLVANSEVITNTILNGDIERVNTIVTETIRPILLSSIKNITNDKINDITNSLKISEFRLSDTKEISQLSSNIASKLSSIISQGDFGKSKNSLIKNSEKYRVATTILGVSTNIIAPWMEVVIIFLPEIINFVGTLFGEKKEDQIKNKFTNTIVPQILSKIRGQIEENVMNTNMQIINEYEKMMNEKIEIIKNSIIELKDKKEEKIGEFKDNQKKLEEEILNIQKNLKEVEK
ncbi:dynamin family protein [Sneathia vaginalis]|uniref:dynamin family protein n=1 Tax=Sneathia vaginalis TaxID=187101 RepID=UPI00372D4093